MIAWSFMMSSKIDMAVHPRFEVDPKRIVEADIHALVEPGADVHEAWHDLSRIGDMIWSTKNGGHWIAVGGDEIRAIYRDTERFSSRNISLPVPPEAFRLSPSGDDGAEHEAARAIIMPFFVPKAIAPMKDTIRQWTRDLVRQIQPLGRCEFMTDFALVLPVEIFLKMVELPVEDRQDLRELAVGMIHEADEDRRNLAFAKTVEYLDKQIDLRIENPGSDVLSAIATSQWMGGKMDRGRALRLALNVLLGGLDSTASMTGFIMATLARDPEARRWFIANPTRRNQAVEELMRRHGVVNNMRTAKQDVEVGGVKVAAGEYVYLVNCLHGLDSRLYPDPLKIDFSRRPQPNAVFGNGPHRCAGANLARMEIAIFLEEWLDHIPDFRIAEGEQVISSSGPVNTMDYLQLEWDN